jgi:hypothetical protein
MHQPPHAHAFGTFRRPAEAALALLLVLVYWATRLPALDALPLHNDEGLHLTRAVEVWNLHPFWEISDGKIINHWLIAAFYPQHEPVFIGRIATVLVGTIGLVCGGMLARRLAGPAAGILAMLLWIASPYLFFYERLAFSDAEAGALAGAALLAAWHLTRHMTIRRAVITGVVLACAVLFKFTAAPFALSIVLMVLLLGRASPRQRITALAIIGLTGAALFAVPLAYLLLRGNGLFTIALGWLGGGESAAHGPAANLARFGALMLGFGSPLAALMTGLGLVCALFTRQRERLVMLAAVLLPFMVTILLGREVLPRHFAATLPAMIVMAGVGLGPLGISSMRSRRGSVAAVAAALALVYLPYMNTSYRQPEAAALPAEVRDEHINHHSAGYGLRDAVRDIPMRVPEPDVQIIASMFPDSCRRANFEAQRRLVCTDAPGTPRIQAALESDGLVYVLTDNAPIIGADVPALAQASGAQAERISGYPRPADPPDDPSVVLWRITR